MSLTRLCACLRFQAPNERSGDEPQESESGSCSRRSDPEKVGYQEDFPLARWLPGERRDSRKAGVFEGCDLETAWWRGMLEGNAEERSFGAKEATSDAAGILEVLGFTKSFAPRDIRLETELKVFVPDYIAAITPVPLSLDVPMPAASRRRSGGPLRRHFRRKRAWKGCVPWRPHFARRRKYGKAQGLASRSRTTTQALVQWLQHCAAGRRAFWRLKTRRRWQERRSLAAASRSKVSTNKAIQANPEPNRTTERPSGSQEVAEKKHVETETIAATHEEEVKYQAARISDVEAKAGAAAPLDVEASDLSTLLSTVEGALRYFQTQMQSFLLQYKEMALRSTFLEPMKFSCAKRAQSCEDSEVERVRAWANELLLEKDSGTTFPGADMLDVWSCLSEEVWEEFSDVASFGRSYLELNLVCAAIDVPRSVMSEAAKDRLCTLFAGHFQAERISLQAILQWSDAGRDAAGAMSRALETLERHFREEEGFCWIPWRLTQERLQRLLAYLGVLRPSAAMTSQLRMEPHRDICPICFEEQADVERLEHWRPVGDVSEHQMCGRCRQEYGQSKCPFCKENLLKEELLDFIESLVAVIYEDGAHDSQELLLVMERWQFHEMEFEAEPRVMRRVAMSLMEHHAFQHRLRHALRAKRVWLWEAAGLIFRLYGFHEVQPLQSGYLLEEALELLLAHQDVERLGLLYEQVLLAWLLSGERPELAHLARRIAWSTVVCHMNCEETERELLPHQILSTVHQDYFEVSHRPLWGSKRQDLMWQTFCAEPRDLV